MINYITVKVIQADGRILSIQNAVHFDDDWGCDRGYYYISDQHGNRYSDDCMSAQEAWQTMTDDPCNDDYIAGLDDMVEMRTMDEITIQIDYHEADLNGVIDYEWYAAFVNRNDDYFDILWYGFPFETYEEAENAAREYLRGLVGEAQP